MIGADVPTLQHRPVALHAVAVRLNSYKLIDAMLHRFMIASQPIIRRGFVSVNLRVGVIVLVYECLQFRRIRVLHDLAGDLPCHSVLDAD